MGSGLLSETGTNRLPSWGPARGEPLSWRDRLVREGRLQPGTQDWGALKISSIERRVDIQASLRAIREDPDEVRRRKRGAPSPVR